MSKSKKIEKANVIEIDNNSKKKLNGNLRLIQTNPEIERKNQNIRIMQAVSGEDLFIKIIRKIIDKQKHNLLLRNKSQIKIDYYNLGIQNDTNDHVVATYCLEKLKEQGRIKDYGYDGIKYTIVEPDIKKLREYINNYNNLEKTIEPENEKNNKYDINFIKTDDEGVLNFLNFGPLTFNGKRAEIVDFFYNSSNKKVWRNYDDINVKISKSSSTTIRQAINNINLRFAKHTDNKNLELIEIQRGKEGGRDVFTYRWKL